MTDLTTRLNKAATTSSTPGFDGADIRYASNTLEAVAAKRIEDLENAGLRLAKAYKGLCEMGGFDFHKVPTGFYQLMLDTLSTQKGDTNE